MPAPDDHSDTPDPVATQLRSLAVGVDGDVVYDGKPVGEYADGVLELDAGWCRLAALSVRVRGDRKAGDNPRSGFIFDRPAT